MNPEEKDAELIDLTEISQIEIYFREDHLYKMLIQAGYMDSIITQSMIKSLKIGKTYNTVETSDMTEVAEPTLRNWLNGRESRNLPSYINSIKEVKFHVLDADSVFRVRLIYLVNKLLKRSINQIAAIATGIPNHNSRVILPSEERIIENDQIKQQNEILMNMFKNLNQVMEFNVEKNEWKIKTNFISLLSQNNNDLKEIKDKMNSLEEQTPKLIQQEVEKQTEEKLKKYQKTLTDTEYNLIRREAYILAKNDMGVMARILKKDPSKSAIEVYVAKLKRESQKNEGEN